MQEKLLSGSVKTLLLKITNIGTLFLVSVLLARTLGAEEYGSYIFVFTLVGLLSEPLFVGLRTVALRNGTIYIQEHKYGLLRGLANRLRLFMLTYGAITALGLFVALWLMQDKLGANFGWTFLFAAALPFLLGFNRINDGLLRASGKALISQIPKLVARPVLLLAYIYISTLLIEDRFDAGWALATQALAAGSAFLIYIYFLRRHLHVKICTARAQYKTRTWFQEALPLAASTAVHALDARIGILLVGALIASSDTGVFHAAFRLAELVVLIHSSANLMIEPMIVRLHSRGNMAELQSKLTKLTRLVSVASVPIIVIMILYGEWLLSLFGDEFRAAAPALQILAFTQLVHVCLGSPAILLNLTKHGKETATGLAGGVVVNVCLCLILIPMLGLVGAAWAALGSMFTTKIYLTLRAQQLLGINTSILGLPPKSKEELNASRVSSN